MSVHVKLVKFPRKCSLCLASHLPEKIVLSIALSLIQGKFCQRNTLVKGDLKVFWQAIRKIDEQTKQLKQWNHLKLHYKAKI